MLKAVASASDEQAFQAERAPVASWYALGVLVLTTLFAFVDRQIINLIAPSLQATLGFSDLQIGALQGLGLAVFASIASYPFGWLADRFGRRLMLCVGVAVWSLSTAACAFQNSFLGLFAATIGIAIGEAGLGPIIFAMIPDLFPEKQRNSANFIYFAAALLGAAAGIALGGLTLKSIAASQVALPSFLAGLDPWRVALLVVAAPGPLFVLLIAAIRGRDGTPAAARITAHGDVHAAPFLPFVRENWKTLACILGTVTAYSFPLMSAFTWLPIAVPRIFGIAPADVGLKMGAAMGIGTIVGLLLPPIGSKMMAKGDPLQPFRLARVLMIVAILPTTLFLTPSAPWQLYLAAASQLAFALAVAAMMPGILQQISPQPLRSRVLALLGILGAIANGVCPLLVGAISGMIPGPRGILAAIVIVGLPGWIVAILLLSLARKPFLETLTSVADVSAQPAF